MARCCLKLALLALGLPASAAGEKVQELTTTAQERLLAGHTTGGDGHQDAGTQVPIAGAPDGFEITVRQGHGADGKDNILFQVKCPREAWCAVGFNNAAQLSMGGGGDGSDIFICAEGEVKRYWVTSQAPPNNGVAVAGSSCEHMGGETHFEFMRQFDAIGDQEIEIDPAMPLWVIWAMGQEGVTELAYHGGGGGNRGGDQIAFRDYDMEEHDHGGSGGGGGQEDEDDPTEIPLESAPDGFEMTVLQGHADDGKDTIRFRVGCPRNAWCAIGFNNAAQLSMGSDDDGSDIFICAEGELKRYWVTSKILPTGGAAVAGSSCEHEGGETHFEFTRNFDANGAKEIEIDPDTPLWVIWAMGPEGTTTLTYHMTGRGGEQVTFGDHGMEHHDHGGGGGGNDEGTVSNAGAMALDAVVALGTLALALGRAR